MTKKKQFARGMSIIEDNSLRARKRDAILRVLETAVVELHRKRGELQFVEQVEFL